MVIRVAVIGAGASGLVALRHLSAKPDIFEAVCYEKTGQLGGTWVYTDTVGTDNYDRPIHSSMYKNLITNFPKEIMGYPDFDFPEGLPSFIRHDVVLQYLHDYADHHNIKQLIRFNTAVEKVDPLKNDVNKLAWSVEIQDVRHPENARQREEFDAVMVCNGHYAVPLMPEFRGLEMFQGQVMHSHDYKTPDEFVGKRVLCIGGSSSGIDLSLELTSYASKVYLRRRSDIVIKPNFPEDVNLISDIDEIKCRSVVLETGEEIEIDVLIFCTGYHYGFPFLTKHCDVKIEDERVTPLYKHVVHTGYPTLTFIGLCQHCIPFPLSDFQVRFVLAILEGKLQLPSKKEMDDDIDRDYSMRLSLGMPTHHAHHMYNHHRDYLRDLAYMADFEPLPSVIENIFEIVFDMRNTDLTGYRKKQFEITGAESYIMYDNAYTNKSSN